MQALYDSALQYEASSDWVQAVETWKACVNETLRQMEECRVQCEVASQRFPEDRDSVGGTFEKAAGKTNAWPLFFKPVKQQEAPGFTVFFLFCPALSLSLLACRQYCVTQVATKPGRISAHEDFLPSQLEHLHIAQFKGLAVNFLSISCYVPLFCSLWIFKYLFLPTAGDVSGAVQTLRTLLLFYPSDNDSLDNLQLYTETLGGDIESQSAQPYQVSHGHCWSHHWGCKNI